MRLKHKIAFWLLKDSSQYDLLQGIYTGGWPARQAARCFEFASKYFLDALKGRDAATLITQSFGICYGKEVRFEVIAGGMAKEIYNTPNPLFDRIRKSYEFVGKPVTAPLKWTEGGKDED